MIQCPECGNTDSFVAFREALIEEELTLDGDETILNNEFLEYKKTYPITLLMCQADGCGMTWNPNPQEDDD